MQGQPISSTIAVAALGAGVAGQAIWIIGLSWGFYEVIRAVLQTMP